jgi:hypothetical protein
MLDIVQRCRWGRAHLHLVARVQLDGRNGGLAVDTDGITTEAFKPDLWGSKVPYQHSLDVNSSSRKSCIALQHIAPMKGNVRRRCPRRR